MFFFSEIFFSSSAIALADTALSLCFFYSVTVHENYSQPFSWLTEKKNSGSKDFTTNYDFRRRNNNRNKKSEMQTEYTNNSKRREIWKIQLSREMLSCRKQWRTVFDWIKFHYYGNNELLIKTSLYPAFTVFVSHFNGIFLHPFDVGNIQNSLYFKRIVNHFWIGWEKCN